LQICPSTYADPARYVRASGVRASPRRTCPRHPRREKAARGVGRQEQERRQREAGLAAHMMPRTVNAVAPRAGKKRGVRQR